MSQQLTTFIFLSLFIIFPVISAILNRWRGKGGFQNNILYYMFQPRPTYSFFLLIPFIYAILSFHQFNITQITISEITYLCLLFFAVWFLAIAPGWGSYFDLGSYPQQPPEIFWIDRLVDIFIPDYYTQYTKDFIGLSLRGLYYTVPVAILTTIFTYLENITVFINSYITTTPIYKGLDSSTELFPLYTLIFALSGLLLGPTYALSEKFFEDYIAYAEFMWGYILSILYLTFIFSITVSV